MGAPEASKMLDIAEARNALRTSGRAAQVSGASLESQAIRSTKTFRTPPQILSSPSTG